ncbi:histone-lysine N-methyltransferase eggless isoform X2 [Cephus cinctus]|uniref:Histone-lysine N-methyltransferase eggless isoform X2 n=1 Tax=Cephus cinctus TaxID=211228 RepID=A0AAJ7VYC7_CEPCN|nr:histone-lysine N-methyltransferase eggless isoform X2 [Cephus cinctus]
MKILHTFDLERNILLVLQITETYTYVFCIHCFIDNNINNYFWLLRVNLNNKKNKCKTLYLHITMAELKGTEVIELDSDEGEIQIRNENLKRKDIAPCHGNCINFVCTSGLNMKIAPSFACAYYGVNRCKKKKRLICEKCFEDSITHQQQLVSALIAKKPLLQCDFPDHTMEVEISDSDDSDDERSKVMEQEDNYLPENVLSDIKEKIDDALLSIFNKYDIQHQIEESHKILKERWEKIDANTVELNKDIQKMMSDADSLRDRFYEDFKPQIQWLKELHIDDKPLENHLYPLVATKKVTQVRVSPNAAQSDTQPEIMPLERVDNKLEPADIPPLGPLIKPIPDVDSIVYVMKNPLMPWVKGKVQSVISKTPVHCRVKLLSKRYNSMVKSVYGKQLAVDVLCPVVVPVGTRVVAIFHDITGSDYHSGVIAEPPKSINKYRYLIFFDDGYAQYVTHKNIFIVAEASPRVWEDIPTDSREFIKKYMESYPERPMVKLQTGQIVKTEWNGKWWVARVNQLDASLVQMHFDADGRTEWIYRGSARLGPLFMELLKANARQHGYHAINTPSRHCLPATTNKNNLPYVEYTSFNPELDDELAPVSKSDVLLKTLLNTSATTTTRSVSITSVPQQSRAVAKKSTTKRPPISNTTIQNSAEIKPSHSIVYYQPENKIKTKKYIPHKCGHECVAGISFTPDDLRGYSPLSIPLLCGWNRQISKFHKGRKVILYQAPCGVRLRNMEEVHQYLRITGSPMSVDLFDFDHWVNCLAEFSLDKCFVKINDLSYGVENVPIPCVNELDHALPDTIRYSTRREPTEGVNLNVDPEFLCCCDCEDDCQDKSKCQCWQLTIQGATLGGRVLNTAVGYVYKRLPEPTCLNRVVQHPLTLKLQVFKTAPRGWGIRCLNDIPLGSFICIYAGRLLTEQSANEGGKNYGDEYLAELDYIEGVEGIKEGYESDVLEPEEVETNTTDDEKKSKTAEAKRGSYESDEDFNVDIPVNVNEAETASIRKRLRKRKTGDDISENASEDPNEDTNKAAKGSDVSQVKLSTKESNPTDDDIYTISDEEDSEDRRREPSRFDPAVEPAQLERSKFKSVRDFFGVDEAVYIMDAKTTGNIGRYLNHSCDPNVFVQNVFVDTHDVRFPWVAFFAQNYIRAGQELTWNYSYDVGSIPGKSIICKCGASNCRGRLL